MNEKFKAIVDALGTIGKRSDGSEDFATNRANLEHMVIALIFGTGGCVALAVVIGYVVEAVK